MTIPAFAAEAGSCCGATQIEDSQVVAFRQSCGGLMVRAWEQERPR